MSEIRIHLRDSRTANLHVKQNVTNYLRGSQGLRGTRNYHIGLSAALCCSEKKKFYVFSGKLRLCQTKNCLENRIGCSTFMYFRHSHLSHNARVPIINPFAQCLQIMHLLLLLIPSNSRKRILYVNMRLSWTCTPCNFIHIPWTSS